MRKSDVVYLLCVFGLAGWIAARSIAQARALLPGGASPVSAAFGVAGQARDVNLPQLERLLRNRALSDHEAEFYEPVGNPPEP